MTTNRPDHDEVAMRLSSGGSFITLDPAWLLSLVTQVSDGRGSTPASAAVRADPPDAGERWYVGCGCDHHGDHLGCDAGCASSGCRHPVGVEFSAPTEAEADAHIHGPGCTADSRVGDPATLRALHAAWVMCVEQQHHHAPGWSMAKSWAWDELREALGALPLAVRLTFNADAAEDVATGRFTGDADTGR